MKETYNFMSPIPFPNSFQSEFLLLEYGHFCKNITISVTFWIQSIRISLLCYLKYFRNPIG